MTRHKAPLTTLSLTLIAALSMAGCGKSDNPAISIAFGSYTAKNRILDLLIPSAYAAVSEGKICFKRLRFKTDGETTSADPSSDSDNVEFNPGQVSITATGTTIGNVTIPAGTYTRVEFDLEKDCPGTTGGAPSVSITNAAGSFTSQDRVTIKFEGTFVADSSGQVLSLGVQSLITALNQVAADGDIKTKLETASGTL